MMINFLQTDVFFGKSGSPFGRIIIKESLFQLVENLVGRDLINKSADYLMLAQNFLSVEDHQLLRESLLLDLISLATTNHSLADKCAKKYNQEFVELLEEEMNNLRRAKAANQSSKTIQQTENNGL